MSWTKREFINQAFNEIGLASYVFELKPEQLQSALKRLDNMMASWDIKGIRVGYPLPNSTSESSLNEVTNCPDGANEAIKLNLAIRLARPHGKVVSPELKNDAKEAYKTLLSLFTQPATLQLPGEMPSGAGNKGWRYYGGGGGNFLIPPVDRVEVGDDAFLELN